MGQIISYLLCKWRYPRSYKSNYQTLVSQQDNNAKPAEQHYCIINISDQNETEIEEAVHQTEKDDHDDHGNEQIIVVQDAVQLQVVVSTTTISNSNCVINVSDQNEIEKEESVNDDHRNDEIMVQDEEVAQALEVVVQNNVSRIPSEISSSVKRIGQYNCTQKILLVGDGDFSFSASLAIAFGLSARNITATSFDSQEFLMNNYDKFPCNKAYLQARGSMVLHDVDANKMAKHPILSNYLFDRIIFNFPHAGRFTHSDSDLQKHQKLIRGFLRNAKKMIEDDGEIHITSKCNGFYLKWDIPKIGSDHGLHLFQEMKFKRAKYPGYNTKYGFGGDKDFDCNPSKTYKFRL
ncbi:unnamed protein product [Amaranthus hypochondriacus]